MEDMIQTTQRPDAEQTLLAGDIEQASKAPSAADILKSNPAIQNLLSLKANTDTPGKCIMIIHNALSTMAMLRREAGPLHRDQHQHFIREVIWQTIMCTERQLHPLMSEETASKEFLKIVHKRFAAFNELLGLYPESPNYFIPEDDVLGHLGRLYNTAEDLNSDSARPITRYCNACIERRYLFETHNCYLYGDHTWCRQCIKRMFEEAMKEFNYPPRCHPGPDGDHFTMQQLQFFFDDEFVQKYQEQEAEFQVKPQDRVYCHKPTCGSFIPPENIDGGSLATCKVCKSLTCATCKEKSHFELDTCPGVIHTEDYKALEKVIKEKRWATCPGCSVVTEKQGGCNHMHCAMCHTEYCYRCGDFYFKCFCGFDPDFAEDFDDDDEEIPPLLGDLPPILHDPPPRIPQVLVPDPPEYPLRIAPGLVDHPPGEQPAGEPYPNNPHQYPPLNFNDTHPEVPPLQVDDLNHYLMPFEIRENQRYPGLYAFAPAQRQVYGNAPVPFQNPDQNLIRYLHRDGRVLQVDPNNYMAQRPNQPVPRPEHVNEGIVRLPLHARQNQPVQADLDIMRLSPQGSENRAYGDNMPLNNALDTFPSEDPGMDLDSLNIQVTIISPNQQSMLHERRSSPTEYMSQTDAEPANTSTGAAGDMQSTTEVSKISLEPVSANSSNDISLRVDGEGFGLEDHHAVDFDDSAPTLTESVRSVDEEAAEDVTQELAGTDFASLETVHSVIEENDTQESESEQSQSYSNPENVLGHAFPNFAPLLDNLQFAAVQSPDRVDGEEVTEHTQQNEPHEPPNDATADSENSEAQSEGWTLNISASVQSVDKMSTAKVTQDAQENGQHSPSDATPPVEETSSKLDDPAKTVEHPEPSVPSKSADEAFPDYLSEVSAPADEEGWTEQTGKSKSSRNRSRSELSAIPTVTGGRFGALMNDSAEGSGRVRNRRRNRRRAGTITSDGEPDGEMQGEEKTLPRGEGDGGTEALEKSLPGGDSNGEVKDLGKSFSGQESDGETKDPTCFSTEATEIITNEEEDQIPSREALAKKDAIWATITLGAGLVVFFYFVW